MSKNVTVITCGPQSDHDCDDDGPTLMGGEDENGSWVGPDTPENRARPHTWGSASCSKCGRTAMDRHMWTDWV